MSNLPVVCLQTSQVHCTMRRGINVRLGINLRLGLGINECLGINVCQGNSECLGINVCLGNVFLRINMLRGISSLRL